jgi:hypothetical protein
MHGHDSPANKMRERGRETAARSRAAQANSRWRQRRRRGFNIRLNPGAINTENSVGTAIEQ